MEFITSTFLGIVLAFSLVADFNSASAEDVSRCPSSLPRTRHLKAAHGWNKCYEFHTEERTWKTARGTCVRRGGELVTIKDARVQAFLLTSLRQLRWPRSGLWIGANDLKKEMEWRWVTGEKVKYGFTNWARGQPSCGLFCFEDCAVMKWKERGQWHDYHCSSFEDYSFICEFDMIPPTTTSTTTTTTITTTTTKKTSTPTTTTLTTSETTPTIMLNGSNARHGQVKQIESDSAGLTSGTLAGLIVGVLIGLSFSVCCVFFILFQRRRRKKNVEDLQVSYENPYYAETPGSAFVATSNSQPACAREGKVEENHADIGTASGGHDLDPMYLSDKGCEYEQPCKGGTKRKSPLPPSTLHRKPKLVMNNYDTPPALLHTKSEKVDGCSGSGDMKSSDSLGGYKRMDKGNWNSRDAAEQEENHYSELRPNSKYVYDVPTPKPVQDYANGTAEMPFDHDHDHDNFYYNEEENMYESLEHLASDQNPEEKMLLPPPPPLPQIANAEEREESEDHYANDIKENIYFPLKTEENEYY